MRMERRYLSCMGAAVFGVAWLIGPATAEQPLPQEAVAQIVAVSDLHAQNGTVSASLVNKSPHVVRNVRLLIRHAWVWKDERHPGTDSPGAAEYYVVPDAIPPGQRQRFTHTPSPPLPQRSDGHFDTSVEVVGFEEVGD